MPQDLKLLRIVVGVLCVALGASAVLLCVGAVAAGDTPKWPLFGMEIVVGAASVLGVLLALGKMRGAPSLALACVAGSIFVAAVLGYFGANGRLDLKDGRAPILLKPILAARLGAVAVIGCVAVYANLRRDSKAMAAFWKGVAWAAPLILMTVAYWKFRGALASAGEGVLVGLACVGGVVAIVTLAGAGHCFIRAFELGIARDDPRPAEGRA